MATYKLTDKAVRSLSRAGRYSDGAGLYLNVAKGGSKSWLFMYRWEDKRPEVGLGGYPTVSLAEARRKANEARGYLSERPKRDPRQVWKASFIVEAGTKTFGEFATEWMDANLMAYRNDKHRQQWRNTMNTFAAPIWNKDIQVLTTEHILGILQPIWQTKPETAKRVQGRMERIFAAAKAQGLFDGQNPSQWQGHLKLLLVSPKREKKPHKAMPYADLPDYVALLRAKNSIAAYALRFLIATAARSGEARGARWTEINIAERIWIIPADRMKAGKEHRVPLSANTIDILNIVADARRSDLVFEGLKQGTPITEAAIRKLLKETAPEGVTTHGFRSSFRDWAGEETSFSREVAELALAHQFGDATERAYRRGDALAKRRELMDAWDRYFSGAGSDNVHHIKSRRAGK